MRLGEANIATYKLFPPVRWPWILPLGGRRSERRVVEILDLSPQARPPLPCTSWLKPKAGGIAAFIDVEHAGSA